MNMFMELHWRTAELSGCGPAKPDAADSKRIT